MQVFVKEALYVLDYQNNIVDTIFLSDDTMTQGYAYNITVEDSNTGYSNLTFTMPTKILRDDRTIGDTKDNAQLIDNPKLKLLTPLVKLRYRRQVLYTGQETIRVQEPVGYGDALVFTEKMYTPEYPHNIIEDYVMDYIVQPTEHKRSGLEVSINYTAIDYPRFNLSKKKMGAAINEETVTKGIWSLYKPEPMSIPGSVQFVRWTETMSEQYGQGANVPTSWSPATATDYPLNSDQIYSMMETSKDWPYGLTATVFWWPITSTGRFEGVLYNEGDYLTLSVYPKFETGEVDVSEITYSLDFYGYTWNYLDKGDSYLTPNNPCNYLNWVLETTNWDVAINTSKQYVGTFFDKEDFPKISSQDQYLLYQVIKEDSKYIGRYEDVEQLPELSQDDVGSWAVISNDAGTYQYRWDGNTWYKEEEGISKIDTYIYTGTYSGDLVWNGEVSNENHLLPMGDDWGFYKISDKFYRHTDFIGATLQFTNSSGEIVHTCTIAEGDTGYLDYEDEDAVVGVDGMPVILSFRNLDPELDGTFMFIYATNPPDEFVWLSSVSFEGEDASSIGEWVDSTSEIWTASIDKATGVLYDVDQVETEITKPNHSVGELFETVALQCSLSASGSNCYNIITEIAKQFQLYPVFDCVNRTVALKLFAGKNYGLTYRLGLSLENTGVKKDGEKVITKLRCFGGQDNQGNENINLGDANREYREPEDNPDEREPWDPNAPEYIKKRSPYGTEYIYNFKWMYDNGWMTKEQILGIYEYNDKIQELNLKFLEPYTKDFLKTNDAYVNAGVVYSTMQDEYLACLKAMMNNYYRHPGVTTEKFSAFPEPPADCRPGDPSKPGENANGYYLDIHMCPNCQYLNHNNFDTCPKCGEENTAESFTIHINTWAEEQASPEGTTSERWKPSSKGYYQKIYDTFAGEEHKFYLTKTFRTEAIDDLTTVPSTMSNETVFFLERKDGEGESEFYDKSAGLYNWNDYVEKWMRYYGLAEKARKDVEYYQARVEMLEQEFKNYQHDLEQLEHTIQDNWGDYIVEGQFTDNQIVYPAVLLAKSLEASDKYATPEITYTLNVVDSSGLVEYRNTRTDTYNELIRTLHNKGQIIPCAGDYVGIYDEELGLYNTPGLITTIRRVLDNPQTNSITLDTAYTDADDLVGNIITATNTVLNNTDIYARTAVLKADGSIDGASLAKTFEQNSNENLSFIGVKGSTLLDSTGLLVSNPSDPNRKMKYTGSGIYGTVDNGASYDLMMGPSGINANYINAGLIDTQSVQIISGQRAKVKLDNLGLSVVDNTSKAYYLPQAASDGGFRDWSNSNLKAFIGVDKDNEALLYLSGQMVVEKGSKIASWNVLEDKLYSGSGTSYVGLGTSGDYRIWAGNSDPAQAPFSVKKNGSMNSTSGTIGDWAIGTNTISQSHTASDGKVYTVTLANYDNDNANSRILHCSIDGTDTFYVHRTGKLYAKNADIEGKITATSGTIGGCTISNGTLQIDNANINSLNVSKINGGTNSKNITFSGNITCSNLTAKASGTIAGWTIDGTSGFTSGNTALRPNGEAYFYPQANGGGEYLFNSGMYLHSTARQRIVSGTHILIATQSEPEDALNGQVYLYGTRSGDGSNKDGSGVFLYSPNGSIRLNATTNVYLTGGGIKLNSNIINIGDSNTSGTINIGASTTTVKIKGVNYIGSSSRAMKENIKPISQEENIELYNAVRDMKFYSYKYKEKYGYGTDEYRGFIIDEIENTIINKYLHFVQDETDTDVKQFNPTEIGRMNLILINQLQHKIEELQQEVETLKKEKTN